jgi:hypothetical protein
MTDILGFAEETIDAGIFTMYAPAGNSIINLNVGSELS